jgi:hypothetical protein
MKKQTLTNLIIIGVSLIGFVYLINVNRDQRKKLAKKENEILKLWDDKIAEYQFLVNVTYRDSENLKVFFDKLEKLFNPNFMTKCIYFQEFDIWEKKENWNLSAGDTTTFMIRLLKNYDLNSHQIELIPSVDLKVIKPYLGELQIVIPKDAKEGEPRKVSFQIYDWVNRDTIVQEMYLNSN